MISEMLIFASINTQALFVMHHTSVQTWMFPLFFTVSSFLLPIFHHMKPLLFNNGVLLASDDRVCINLLNRINLMK